MNIPFQIISWSKKYGIPPEILVERLVLKYWDLFAALVVPSSENVEFCFRSLGGKAYFSVPWRDDDELVSTPELIQHYRPEYSLLYYLLNPDEQYTPYHCPDEN